jgi:hypothetical protein
MKAMSMTLHVKVRVLPGHKIELVDPRLPEGDAVDVTVVVANGASSTPPLSALNVIRELCGHRLFASANDVDQHMREERDSWDR